MTLSLRGAERQPPNVLQQALRFSTVMRPRWLLGAAPKNLPENFKRLMAVTPTSQLMFMELVIQQFQIKCRKVRPNQRAKVRLSCTEWDQNVNYSCMMAAVLEEGKKMSEVQDGWEVQVHKAFEAMYSGLQ